MVAPRSLRIDATHVAAGQVTSTLVVAGIPLVTRQVRQAARLGWTGATVVVSDDASARQVADALARRPGRAGFAVTITRKAPPGDDCIELDGRAIYAQAALAAATPAAPPEAIIRLDGAADVRSAERKLYATVRKNPLDDGFLSHHLTRPLSIPLTRALLPTRVRPNQETAGNLLWGRCAPLLVATGGRVAGAEAGQLFW